MLERLGLLLGALRALASSRRDLVLENRLLRQQPLARSAGVVMAPRTTDKCHTHLEGAFAEYSSNCDNCGREEKLFTVFGPNADKFADMVRRARQDRDVEAFGRPKVAGRPLQAMEAWNRQLLRYEPDLSRPAYQGQGEARARRAPGRTGITLWVHLSDIDEGRPVPTPQEAGHSRSRSSSRREDVRPTCGDSDGGQSAIGQAQRRR